MLFCLRHGSLIYQRKIFGYQTFFRAYIPACFTSEQLARGQCLPGILRVADADADKAFLQLQRLLLHPLG